MRLRHALACAALCACVPSTEAGAPRGAAGFDIVPSSGSRGTPFVTDDGYTITIERLVVLARVSSNDATVFDTYGRVLRGTQGGAIFQRALPLGTTEVQMGLQGLYIGEYGQNVAQQVEDWDLLSPAEQARLSLPADSSGPGGSSGGLGPAALLDVRATRGTTTFTLRTSLAAASYFSREHNVASLQVQADALVTQPAQLRGEALFSTSTGQVRFATFASADTDGDGVVSREELQAAPIALLDAADAELESSRPTTAMELLVARMQRRLLTVHP